MMAMIALAMKEDPVGVASGAILGHALATVLAVTIGSIACKYVSEKVVHIIRSHYQNKPGTPDDSRCPMHSSVCSRPFRH
jgi:hypothetical protein